MGKKNKQQQHRRSRPDVEERGYRDTEQSKNEEEDENEGQWAEDGDENDAGLRHELYQRAVQSPKGEISYMSRFFLTYIGGRTPLHMREDFCGTALICAEWVRVDARRTAVGVDLDKEALSWGLANNIDKMRGDAANRVQLFHQDVLLPLAETTKLTLNAVDDDEENENEEEAGRGSDIVCALNFSCCCLQQRKDLVSYFKQALSSISIKGGVFVMDLYGGSSSEQPLRLRRRYNDFTYTWEQDEFDVINRTSRISLHFQLKKTNKLLRHAFTYHWRLWTIPEIRDCLTEAGFDSTHLWMCEMPEIRGNDEQEAGEYQEMKSFNQCEAWNAYIVGVKQRKRKEPAVATS